MSFNQFLIDHWAALTFAGLYFFTAIVGTMPVPGDPRPKSQQIYQWLFDTLHVISNRVIERRPELQPRSPEPPKPAGGN